MLAANDQFVADDDHRRPHGRIFRIARPTFLEHKNLCASKFDVTFGIGKNGVQNSQAAFHRVEKPVHQFAVAVMQGGFVERRG